MRIPVEIVRDRPKVLCPKLKRKVNTFSVCRRCDWLIAAFEEKVMCRWTREKEELANGTRMYDTT